MITLLFLILAGICNATMDKVMMHFDKSIFRKLNPKWWDYRISQNNKYKDNDPSKGAKFFGSTTIFVFLTDAWHFSKFLMILFFACAIVFYKSYYNPFLEIILYYTIFCCTFELFFTYIFRKKI